MTFGDRIERVCLISPKVELVPAAHFSAWVLNFNSLSIMTPRYRSLDSSWQRTISMELLGSIVTETLKKQNFGINRCIKRTGFLR